MASTNTSTLEPSKITEAQKAAHLKSPKYLTDRAALLSLSNEIRISVALVKADPDQCIFLLEKFKHFQFTQLLLMLTPDCVETIRSLRTYVGNLEEWEMSEKEKLEFKRKANKIRKQARSIYNNIKNMLNIPEPFWEGFMNESAKTHLEYQTASLNAEDSAPKAN